MSDSDDEKPIAITMKKKATKKPTTAEGDEARTIKEPKKDQPKKKVKKEAVEGDEVKVKREKAERPTEWQEWQKAAAPPETDPARKFYTSLLQQIPSSEMAKRWCLRFGVLPPDQAKVIWAELEKKGKSMGKSPAVAVKTKPRLAKVEDEEDEEDERPKAKKAPRSTGAKSKRPNEDDDDDDDDESDEPIVKKGRVKKEAKASVKKPVAKKDVAFDDGGLGEDDDDDKPILAKAKKANPPVKAQMPAPLPPAAQDDDDSDDLPLIKRAKA